MGNLYPKVYKTLVLRPPEIHLLYLLWLLTNAASGEAYWKSRGSDAVFGSVGKVMGGGGIVNWLNMFLVLFFAPSIFTQCFWNGSYHFDLQYLYQLSYPYLQSSSLKLESISFLININVE